MRQQEPAKIVDVVQGYLKGAKLGFSGPGKPTDNAFIEAFNGRFRQECPKENWFLSLEDAVEKVELWQRRYNSEMPHRVLGNLSPSTLWQWPHRWFDPQDSHSDWYRKWGKVMRGDSGSGNLYS